MCFIEHNCVYWSVFTHHFDQMLNLVCNSLPCAVGIKTGYRWKKGNSSMMHLQNQWFRPFRMYNNELQCYISSMIDDPFQIAPRLVSVFSRLCNGNRNWTRGGRNWTRQECNKKDCLSSSHWSAPPNIGRKIQHSEVHVKFWDRPVSYLSVWDPSRRLPSLFALDGSLEDKIRARNGIHTVPGAKSAWSYAR